VPRSGHWARLKRGVRQPKRKEQSMQVRGIDLAVTILGTGRPFIWGHGMTWSRALEEESGLFLWHGLADLLQIIRYDARGHGTSEASTPSRWK